MRILEGSLLFSLRVSGLYLLLLRLPSSIITAGMNSVFVEEYYSLGCDAMKSGENLSTVRKHVLPPPSGLTSKPSKKEVSFFCLLLTAIRKILLPSSGLDNMSSRHAPRLFSLFLDARRYVLFPFSDPRKSRTNRKQADILTE
jgi:hypothetical protein